MGSITATAGYSSHTWRVWVTDEDVHRAGTAWTRARDGGAPADRVRDLLEELERLSRTATLQAAGVACSGGELRAVTVVASSRTSRRVDRGALLRAAG